MDTADRSAELEKAIALAQGPNTMEAEKCLRQLVASGVRDPLASMALGVVCGQRGDKGERRLWFQQARRLVEADGARPSLQLLLNQSIDALEQGEPDQALAFGQEALSFYPEEARSHLHQARLFTNLGRKDDALVHLDFARDLLQACGEERSEALDGWRLLAQAEVKLGLWDVALQSYGTALEKDPNHVPTLLAFSQILIDRGSLDAAMPWLMNALAVDPTDPEVLCRNGMAIRKLGQLDEAIQLFREALTIDPDHDKSLRSLAGCLMDQGLAAEALAVYETLLRLQPKDLDSRLGYSLALRQMADTAQALAIQKQLMEEHPTAFGPFGSWMFSTSISTSVPAEEVLATARRFWSSFGVAAQERSAFVPATPRASGSPLRVGILSGDIGQHVVGLFLDPLLRHHDPERCKIEILSMQRRYDPESERLAGLADGFHSLEGLPNADARDILKRQAYDLILDTSGLTRGSGIHLLTERCAPVQAHYIGYHATTGLSTLDAFIGDQETAAPDLQEQFSETLWRLPRPWLAYPKDQLFPNAEPLMETDRPVLGAFSQVSKLTEETLTFWAEALRRVPEAVLVLKDRGFQDPAIRTSLEQRLADLGVHPGRLTFIAPLGLWSDHVYHYNFLDLALDTTPWSSATTGFEALAMGVPLLAIRGKTMASRMSSSLVKGVGRSPWISSTPTDFADVVETLCGDLSALRKEKKDRQQQTFASPLFDGPDLARHCMDLFAEIVSSS